MQIGGKINLLFRINWQGQAAQKISTQNGRDVESVDVAIVNSSNPSGMVEKSACTVSILSKAPVKNRCIVEPLRREIDCGGNADAGFSPAQQSQHPMPTVKDAVKEKQIKFADIIDHVDESYNAVLDNKKTTGTTVITTTATTTVYQTAIRLSPRLEMRLALNHDILGDEDLISFEPGPANLEQILGRDLSSYHRCTGKELTNYRTPNHHRIAPKEANISFSTQKNSKMDTPTPNRRKTNPNTWNNSACAAAGEYGMFTKQKTISFISHISRDWSCPLNNVAIRRRLRIWKKKLEIKSNFHCSNRKKAERPGTIGESGKENSAEDLSSGTSVYKSWTNGDSGNEFQQKWTQITWIVSAFIEKLIENIQNSWFWYSISTKKPLLLFFHPKFFWI